MGLEMEQAYRSYAQPVYRYLYSLCRDEQLAEELCAETFYRAVKNSNRYDGSCKLLTWLCAIAKNVWYAELDKRRRRGETLPLEEQTLAQDDAEAPHQLVEAAQARLALYQRLQRLDALSREVVYLRLHGDLSYRDIGEILGKTETWARVTFYRAKEKLKKEGDLYE